MDLEVKFRNIICILRIWNFGPKVWRIVWFVISHSIDSMFCYIWPICFTWINKVHLESAKNQKRPTENWKLWGISYFPIIFLFRIHFRFRPYDVYSFCLFLIVFNLCFIYGHKLSKYGLISRQKQVTLVEFMSKFVRILNPLWDDVRSVLKTIMVYWEV